VIGDLALSLVAAGADPEAFEENPSAFDLPGSVIGFLHGELGDPPGGWPEPFRSKAIKDRPWTAPDESLSAEDETGLHDDRRTTLNRLLFPAPTREFDEARAHWGDISVLETLDYLYGLRQGEEHVIDLEPGVQLIVGLQAISEPDERGYRTVLATLNGQLRPVSVRDRSVSVQDTAVEKADPAQRGQVAAPFQGVANAKVAVGDTVQEGETVAIIEAMKMESDITAPKTGTVTRVIVTPPRHVEGGDLLLEIE
jgi:pyruvate carboxylase